MALAKSCDICGKFYRAYNVTNNKKQPSGIMLVNVCENGSYYEGNVIDCCPDCMHAITKIIENLKPIEKREVKTEND